MARPKGVFAERDIAGDANQRYFIPERGDDLRRSFSRPRLATVPVRAASAVTLFWRSAV